MCCFHCMVICSLLPILSITKLSFKISPHFFLNFSILVRQLHVYKSCLHLQNGSDIFQVSLLSLKCFFTMLKEKRLPCHYVKREAFAVSFMKSSITVTQPCTNYNGCCLTLDMLNKLGAIPPTNFQPVSLLFPSCSYKFKILMTNSADPDQLAS